MSYIFNLRLSIVLYLVKLWVESNAAPQHGGLNPIEFNGTIRWENEVIFVYKAHIFEPLNHTLYERVSTNGSKDGTGYQLRLDKGTWRIDLLTHDVHLKSSNLNSKNFKWSDLKWSWRNNSDNVIQETHYRAFEVTSNSNSSDDNNMAYQIAVPVLVLVFIVLIVVGIVLVKKFRKDVADQPQPKNFPTLREADGLTLSQSFKSNEYIKARTIQEILKTEDRKVADEGGYINMDRGKR